MRTTSEVKLKQRADEISDAHPGVEVLYHDVPGERWMELHYREMIMPGTWKEDGRPMPAPVPLADPSIPALAEALAAWQQFHGEPRVVSEPPRDDVRIWHIESA